MRYSVPHSTRFHTRLVRAWKYNLVQDSLRELRERRPRQRQHKTSRPRSTKTTTTDNIKEYNHITSHHIVFQTPSRHCTYCHHLYITHHQPRHEVKGAYNNNKLSTYNKRSEIRRRSETRYHLVSHLPPPINTVLVETMSRTTSSAASALPMDDGCQQWTQQTAALFLAIYPQPAPPSSEIYLHPQDPPLARTIPIFVLAARPNHNQHTDPQQQPSPYHTIPCHSLSLVLWNRKERQCSYQRSPARHVLRQSRSVHLGNTSVDQLRHHHPHLVQADHGLLRVLVNSPSQQREPHLRLHWLNRV